MVHNFENEIGLIIPEKKGHGSFSFSEVYEPFVLKPFNIFGIVNPLSICSNLRKTRALRIMDLGKTTCNNVYVPLRSRLFQVS